MKDVKRDSLEVEMKILKEANQALPRFRILTDIVDLIQLPLGTKMQLSKCAPSRLVLRFRLDVSGLIQVNQKIHRV